MTQHFMVIDDSELDCFIAEKMIRHTVKDANTALFTDAKSALEQISRSPADTGQRKTIIFLDILMPVMDGFGFMNEFEKMPQAVQANFLVVGLTSSMNKKDLMRISEYRTMSRLLDKPLTSESVLTLMEEIESGKLAV